MVIRLDPRQAECIKQGICYIGGEKVYEALNEVGPPEGPGHIYSEAGLREYKNSGCCEFHFDNMFAPDPHDPVDKYT